MKRGFVSTAVWKPRMSGLLVTFGISLIYAVCYTAIKTGLTYSPPLVFGGIRALIGGAALLVLLPILRKPFFPSRKNWGSILLVGLSSTTLTFGGMFLSPGRTGAGIASVLGNVQPLVALGLAALFLGERLTRQKMITLTFGLIGVVLIAYPALAGSSIFGIAGPILALAASFGAAIGSILVKRLGNKEDFLVTAAWQLLLGSLPLLVSSVLTEQVNRMAWTLEFTSILLFLALVGTSLVTVIWYSLLQKYEVGQLTLFLFLTPLLGLGMAVLAFHEQVGLVESVGVVLILVGIGVTARKTDWPEKIQ
jgi:drug/metabolite transporter (DMT)-like permease